MDSAGKSSPKDAATEEYASLSQLLLEFTNIPTIEQAWTFKSGTEDGSHAMFLMSQPNLLSNSTRKSILSTHILRNNDGSLMFKSSPFPIEMTGVSLIVPSPSGSNLFVIRNSKADSRTRFEIWGPFGIMKEFNVPHSIHGPVYSDGWFEGVSWNSDETMIAYVAEEPEPPKPTFITTCGYRDSCNETDCNTWKGQGDWEEDWGEAYAGNRQPSLFVINICSGKVCAVTEVGRELSVGQVVWAPAIRGEHYLVIVGWPSNNRKFGIKYCTNRPCSLYAIKAPLFESENCVSRSEATKEFEMVNLTQTVSSAMFPRFSPDGKFLVFLSAASSVDSGAHQATDSLHKIAWPSHEKLGSSMEIIDLVPVEMCPEDDDHFPGLYCKKILTQPWLSDGDTMVLTSVWGSTETILSVNIVSGEVSRISPKKSNSSWEVLALDGDSIIAVCSSPVDIPEIKYGREISTYAEWNWLDVLNLTTKCSEMASSILASLQFDILKIPVRDVSENQTKGSRKDFDAIYVSSKKPELDDPLIVILHGGPHDVSTSSFSKSSAFLCSIGYGLLIVNYRGSRGFGEEALQSLPGKVGSQDVNDVLTAIDYIILKGLANPSKIAVVGLSHGGFLTAHLIGQAPEKFAAAAARNPVCNLALMMGTTDIPDWCFFEAYGNEARLESAGSPSAEHLAVLYSKSPIYHVSKVKTPTLMLLGAKDVRVPIYDGKQYVRALQEKGVETKVILFPNDIHEINRPQSDFESFLNIGLWFNKYCK